MIRRCHKGNAKVVGSSAYRLSNGRPKFAYFQAVNHRQICRGHIFLSPSGYSRHLWIKKSRKKKHVDFYPCSTLILLFVTLHGISGDKVIACTRHIMTHRHVVDLRRLTCSYALKSN